MAWVKEREVGVAAAADTSWLPADKRAPFTFQEIFKFCV